MSQDKKFFSNNHKKKIRRALGRGLLIIIAVILPALTLIIELISAMSADSFIDPIPTIYHILLVASVPVINLFVYVKLKHYKTHSVRRLYRLLSFSIGVSLLYTIAYLPILPISIIAIALAGIGLLPLSPLMSLIGSFTILFMLKSASRQAIKEDEESSTQDKESSAQDKEPSAQDKEPSKKEPAPANHRPGFSYLSFFAVFVIIAILEIPGMLTNYGLALYQSGNVETKRQGLTFLKRWGSESILFTNTYTRPLRLFDLGGYFFQVNSLARSQKMARAAYFQLTGIPFNTLPAPKNQSRNQLGFRGIPGTRLQRDDDQGEQKVGGRVDNLWLHSSTLDGVLMANTGIAYLEWTFEYKNASTRQAEVRKEIQLPPNAVISRVTLWVNGVEREAVITPKSKATKAYRTLVRRKRDPILVTLTGKDRALIQMFPVPAGGIMKARIGLTIPLQFKNEKTAFFTLPKINTSNFLVPNKFTHSFWLETKLKDGMYFYAPGISNDKESKRSWTSKLITSIPHSTFESDKLYIGMQRNNISTSSFALLTPSISKALSLSGAVKQTISTTKNAYDHIIVVLDGSLSSKKHRKTLIKVIQQLPDNITIEFILSGDKAQVIHPMGALAGTAKKRLISTLQSTRFAGGKDNILGLQAAMKRSLSVSTPKSRTAVVWIHGPQPYLLSSMSQINQYAKRSANKLTLFYVPTESGSNKIIQAMPAIPSHYFPNHFGWPQGFTHLWGQLSGQNKFYQRQFSIVPTTAVEGTPQSSTHLIRLWANHKIDTLLSNKRLRNSHEATIKKANAISKTIHLVTAVSGALVLATDKEYKQHGIDKRRLTPGMVPGVPEPGTWALFIITGLMFGVMVLRQGRKNRKSST